MRNFLKRLKLAMLGICIGAVVTAAQAQEVRQQLAGESLIESVKRNGTLRVGVSTFVPWAMNAKDGSLVGFEVDVAKKLAEDMGVGVELVPTAWDGIIPALLAGKFDVIISGMSVTPKRNLTVNFTIPYARSGVGMAANSKLAGNFKTLQDFNQPSVKLAVRRGVVGATLAQELMPKAELLQFDDDAQVVQEVLNGNAHAFLTSEPKPTFEVLMHPDVLEKPFDGTLNQQSEAFAVRKGDPDAVNFFNNWILYRTQDGWLQQRHDYWFTTRDWVSLVEGQ
jgi:polar amino acid transport system substrate-binding protein